MIKQSSSMRSKSLHSQSNKNTPRLSHRTNQPIYLLALGSSIAGVAAQVIWNKVSHSKSLILCLLAVLFMVGTVFWNQASEYYKSLAVLIFQNQRLTRENQQFVENKLHTWQKAASLQPNSEVLNLEIKTLLPSPN